ncbi:penicillin-binding transpeptidase domain-containing protein [Actinomadura macrotermitis]|uniref:penicillin-binding transpeptidase domain-containing protein n=1 Tax=Actinomadura macrotermitis TaxID=2585200 RepID=UPI002E25E157
MAAVGTLVASLTSGCFAEPSVMPTVRDFLIAWQVGNYKAAAKLTTGADRAAVENTLGQVRGQLDAASLKLALGTPTQNDSDANVPAAIVKNGDQADARFSVKIDLGENGEPWSYTSLMHLKRVGDDWKVVWSPSIINPSLKPGQRLAVLTEVPERAPILDSTARSLQLKVKVGVAGVYPEKLRDPQRVMDQLAKAVAQDGGRKLDVERLIGRIRSAPPQRFLPLLTLQRQADAALLARLARIDGLFLQFGEAPIAAKLAPELIGNLGPATDDTLQQVGAPYQPGDTIGVNGLQLVLQRRLAGTPTVQVVAQDPSGRDTKELRSWPGSPPQEVRTTLNGKYQPRADRALAGLKSPASLIALNPSTGDVLANANHLTNGANLAMQGHYPPGLTFGLVSAQTLLLAGAARNTRIDCPGTATVGDRTFTNRAAGATTLEYLFARNCTTTLAELSKQVDTKTLMAAVDRFGIGKNWGMTAPVFTGSVPAPANEGDKAATFVGQGRVRVSPLNMALVAAAVQNGSWKPPYVLTVPRSTETPLPVFMDQVATSEMQKLARRSIASGATAANIGQGANAVNGVVASVDYDEGGVTKTVTWFVGYRADIAFAIAVEGKANLAKLAARFLTGTAPAR